MRRFLCGTCRIEGQSVGLCIPLSLLGNNSVKTFPRQCRIVGRVVFYVVRVVSNENRLVLPRTSCLSWLFNDVVKHQDSVVSGLFLRAIQLEECKNNGILRH
jgi:hypothetical protein